jgi:NADH-quinone oxidoreductase subunit L
MSTTEAVSWVCLFAPLAGVVLLTLAGSRISRELAAWAGTAFALASFVAAVVVAYQLHHEPKFHHHGAREHVYTLYTWASSGTFRVPFDILVDPLSVVEMLIVSGVGTLIVAYSIGYMHGDPKERRFFVYLDLFLFSMLLLVMSANFALLLAGWGLVGLSSYLLIGFWHERKAPVDAAKKAFVMNAVGDVGIAIAIFIMVRDLGTVEFQGVFDQAGARWAQGSQTANWIAFLLLVGAVAKSAQIPLHTWLPDAMEGPTPVSALIHAATMVTAGVYLVARTHVLFENAPDIQALVALTGVATLLMAGVIALVQTDIKRIIAYSTMSQIGYMFAAVGIGAYSAGMFLLLAHAFFKALLFLGSGIVIHALSGEQDVRRMGGLQPALRKTATLMWIGTIGLIGFWPLAKDAVLASALAKGGTTAMIVWVGGLIGAFFTGVYATRLMRLTFYGQRSTYADVHLHDTSHGEAPWTMFWTVAALAVGTILVGFLAIGFGTKDELASWLRFVAPTVESSVSNEVLTTALGWGAGLAGMALVFWAYARPERLARIKQPLRAGAVAAENLFYWDAAYRWIAYLPASAIASALYRWVERWIIWGSVSVVTYVVRAFSRAATDAQNGVVRLYATAFAAGAAVLAAYFLTKASL